MDRASELGADVPLHFSAFHPDWRMRGRRPTPPATLPARAAHRMGNGLRYVYTGNVHDPAGGSTYCHGCGERLIGRDWYDITSWAMTADGRCAKCGAACGGVFEANPGAWGARRLPIRVSAA